jgi:hypothetical protein
MVRVTERGLPPHIRIVPWELAAASSEPSGDQQSHMIGCTKPGRVCSSVAPRAVGCFRSISRIVQQATSAFKHNMCAQSPAVRSTVIHVSAVSIGTRHNPKRRSRTIAAGIVRLMTKVPTDGRPSPSFDRIMPRERIDGSAPRRSLK